MNIQVRVFGPLKEYFPAAMQVELEDGMFSDHIIAKLADQNPSARAMLNSTRIAVGDEIISDHMLLNEHHEISLLPPSSGG